MDWETPETAPNDPEKIPVVVWAEEPTYEGWLPAILQNGKFYFLNEDITEFVQGWFKPTKPTLPDGVDILC